MHVSDDKKTVALHVFDADGNRYDLEVGPDLNIQSLKTMCLTHFLKDPLVSVKVQQSYKLVSTAKKRPLNEDMSLLDEQVSDGTELLLLKRIPYKRHEDDSLETHIRRTAPTNEEIAEATQSVEPKNLDKAPIEIPNTINFQKELRKILVSLIEYSYDLLKTHPEVQPLLGDLKFGSDADSKAQKEVIDELEKDGLDREVLKQLIDMGFGVDRAKRALKLNNMSAVDAMDWLLANESAFESSSSSSLRTDSELDINDPKAYSSATGLCPTVPVIVDRYRRYKRKNFRANPKAFKGLCDMGFDENEVMDALNVHSNNEIAACEWLLSERRPKLKDLEIGLCKDSAIYKAIVDNAVIQLGLVKPRIFFAFLQLVEEPNSTGRWLSDSQMSPILSQMFRIFHSEKHAIDES